MSRVYRLTYVGMTSAAQELLIYRRPHQCRTEARQDEEMRNNYQQLPRRSVFLHSLTRPNHLRRRWMINCSTVIL